MKLKYVSGNTPLVENKALSKKYNLDNLFIKDESHNPFGTFKDRASEFVLKKAIRDKIDKLVLISSGNACFSMSQFARGSNVEVACVIDKKMKSSIKKSLLKTNKNIHEVDLSSRYFTSKQLIELVRDNPQENIIDATNNSESVYVDIIREIKGKHPNYIIIPVGSGIGFLGLYQGIKKYKLNTQLIGVDIINKDSSFADKLCTPWTPNQSKIDRVIAEGHKLISISEKEVKTAYNDFRKYIDCEPSSAVVLMALNKIKFSKKDTVILINTGQGLY